jgi:hypothetical protein
MINSSIQQIMILQYQNSNYLILLRVQNPIYFIIDFQIITFQSFHQIHECFHSLIDFLILYFFHLISFQKRYNQTIPNFYQIIIFLNLNQFKFV